MRLAAGTTLVSVRTNKRASSSGGALADRSSVLCRARPAAFACLHRLPLQQATLARPATLHRRPPRARAVSVPSCPIRRRGRRRRRTVRAPVLYKQGASAGRTHPALTKLGKTENGWIKYGGAKPESQTARDFYHTGRTSPTRVESDFYQRVRLRCWGSPNNENWPGRIERKLAR